jgi:hypothetical protein
MVVMEKWGLREINCRYELCVMPMTPAGVGDPLVICRAHRLKLTPVLPALQPARDPDGYLNADDAMRLALGFLAAPMRAPNAHRFVAGVGDLPGEVTLYWFTGAYYGYRKMAFRQALKALLLYPSDGA